MEGEIPQLLQLLEASIHAHPEVWAGGALVAAGAGAKAMWDTLGRLFPEPPPTVPQDPDFGAYNTWKDSPVVERAGEKALPGKYLGGSDVDQQQRKGR